MTKQLTLLYIAIGSSSFIALIFALICIRRRRRARYLGVVPERRYANLPTSETIVPPPAVAPIFCNFNGTRTALFPPLVADKLSPMNTSLDIDMRKH